MMKIWGGRFTKQIDKCAEEFLSSIHFDKVLWEDDILGSLAHVKALEHAKLISHEEMQLIFDGLHALKTKIATGEVGFKMEDEDIHMNIEQLLVAEIGDVARKLHTGRSRNDQVALDLHLYLRRQILSIIENILLLQNSLLTQAKENIDLVIPGYTHLQRAQPVRVSHHLLAYTWMFERDLQKLQHNFKSVNKLPLGAGAVAGTSFSLDQAYVAQMLQFESVYENSMDAVSNRDFVVELLSTASLIMMHLSKLSEELILWSSQEFALVELDDAFCTGSSIMPQKKNPDAAELIRGKTGRVYGALTSILTTLKGLPLAYNKDLQEDKEILFDAIKTVNACVRIMAKMVATMKINSVDLNSGFLSATELANYLVKKGLTFRKAHEIVGELVKHCVTEQYTFSQLNMTTLKTFSELFTEDVLVLFDVKNLVEMHTVQCGTSKGSVTKQLLSITNKVTQTSKWLSEQRKKLLDLPLVKKPK